MSDATPNLPLKKEELPRPQEVQWKEQGEIQAKFARESQTPPKRIAVVAVHGVSDQKPYETAQSIANLLLNIDRDASTEHTSTTKCGTRYAPFEERFVRVAVRPLLVGSAKPIDPGHAFMRELVQGYHTDDPKQSFGTICLRGLRRERQGDTREKDEKAREVHIYEMYWADLSRLGGGLLDVFGELGQILFHLPDLGLIAVRQAVKDRKWMGDGALLGMRWWSSAILTLIIPVLNLLLVYISALAFAALIPSNRLVVVSAAVLSVILLAAAEASIYFWADKHGWIYSILTILASVAIGIFAGLQLDVWWASFVLAMEWVLVGGAGCWLLLQTYARRKPPEARWLMMIETAGAVLLLGFFVFREHGSGAALASASMHACECIFALLVAAWLAFGFFQFCNLVLGIGGIAARWKTPDRSTFVSAIYTSWFSSSLPAVLFLLFILPLYAAFLLLAANAFADVPFAPILFQAEEGGGGAANLKDFAWLLLFKAATPAFILMVLASGLSFVALIVAFLPAVIADVLPPKSNALTEELRQSLDGAIKTFPLLCCGLIVVTSFIPLGVMATFPACDRYLRDMGLGFWLNANGPNQVFLYALGAALVGGASGLLAFKGRLQSLALGFRVPVDAMLDVDNHLRKYPLDDNARSQIAARCASLLRYLRRWEDPRDKRPYDAIVIISHSQGTAIMVETLRFAHLENQEVLAGQGTIHSRHVADRGPVVHLLTMGCPLRQLYRWRFPHLYEWVSHIGTADLNIQTWVNAYRSGDFVGREVWDPNAVPPNCKDVCIGAGAHTHYWDKYGVPIAELLDYYLANA